MTIRHARRGPHVDAHPLQRARGIVRQILRQGGQHPRAGFEQDDAGRARIDPPEIVGQCLARDIGDRPRHFDACCTAADDDESEEPLPLGVVVHKLGLLECQENAAANAGRVFDALEPRRDSLPLVVTEIGMHGPRGDDQIVIRHRTGAGFDAPSGGIHAGDIRHQHRRILLLAQDMADRPGDLRRRQRSGRDLIKQRLKAMMVLAIDQGHVDGRAGKGLRGHESAEARPDNDHLGPRLRHPPSPSAA